MTEFCDKCGKEIELREKKVYENEIICQKCLDKELFEND